jgi:hypothetical protein
MTPLPSDHPPRPRPSPARRVSGREQLGFRDGNRGAHSSRTMMLYELTQTLAATHQEATRETFRTHIVAENLIGKRTESNRVRADGYLHQLYGLNLSVPVYRLLRRFWRLTPTGAPYWRCSAPAPATCRMRWRRRSMCFSILTCWMR